MLAGWLVHLPVDTVPFFGFISFFPLAGEVGATMICELGVGLFP